MWRTPKPCTVPVEDGLVHAWRWGEGPNLVIGLHGITANHASFGEVGDAICSRQPDVTLLAPDLRGRGGSAGLPGPFGIGRHAEDVATMIRALGGEPVVLVGHSMGAYVAAVVASRHPGLVRGVVLVDGGLPLDLDLPVDLPAEAAIGRVIGPALSRLDTTYPDEAAHEATFRDHPALQAHWSATLTAYAAADRVAVLGGWRSAVNREAVIADGVGPLQDREVRSAIEHLTVPTLLLRAQRGMLDEPTGLLSPTAVAAATTANPLVVARTVEDVNHYTIVFDPAGADRVVEAVVDLLT
jgi:pimeloyl-ACP methyl ester carboxylesterase